MRRTTNDMEMMRNDMNVVDLEDAEAEGSEELEEETFSCCKRMSQCYDMIFR